MVCHKCFPLLLYGQSSHRQYVSEWVWLCPSKTLFIGEGGKPDLPMGCSLPTFGINCILMKNCCILEIEIESNNFDNTQCHLKVIGDFNG